MELLQRVVRLLYPDRCPGCGVFGTLLCDACTGRLRFATGSGRCPHCRSRWEGNLNCPRCFGWDAIDATVVVCEMEGVGRRLVHALKYRGVWGVADPMARLMTAAAGGSVVDGAYAVPLHPARERRRGFNQAALLLDALAWPRGPGRLVRVRATASQVGMRERERGRNVAGAFAFEGPDLDGRAVAVVDDVITTGSTVVACARLLRERGARTVTAVAFARAHYRPGTTEPIVD